MDSLEQGVETGTSVLIVQLVLPETTIFGVAVKKPLSCESMIVAKYSV